MEKDSEFWSCDRYDSEAQRLYDSGDYDAALRLLKEGIELYPSSAELRISLGYSYLAREEYAWARRAFEEALILAPDHEEAMAGLGDVLLKLGERSRAFVAFERILELGFDEDPELLVCIGRALMRESLYARAERFFRLALASDPRYADAAYELAGALWRSGDVEGAIRACRRALIADTDHQDARALCGNLLYERGDFAGALKQLERIPPADFWDPVAVWRTVELLRRLRGLEVESVELAPYVERMEILNPEPSPEEQLLAEVEALQNGGAPAPRVNGRQLDLFGLEAWVGRSSEEPHRVRATDGSVFEGDWEAIVHAMRDGSGNPHLSIAEFMQDEARRIHNLTGVWICCDDARTFIQEFARVGAIHIER